MSTTTPSSNKIQEEEGAVAQTAGRNIQGWLLILLVFVAGACSLAVELSASRLLAPYFGTSLFVWANLIGLILLYLTIGYYLGGRLADRYPRPEVLYTLTIIAAFLISLIPFLSKPILQWSQSSFASYSVGVFYGSLLSVISALRCADDPAGLRLTVCHSAAHRAPGQVWSYCRPTLCYLYRWEYPWNVFTCALPHSNDWHLSHLLYHRCFTIARLDCWPGKHAL